MPAYDREYDREYEEDYDTDGKDELVRSARGADRAFAASLPSAVEVQNSISMGDVNGGGSESSYVASLKGAWRQNKRRMIIISSVTMVFAIMAITLSLTIDRTPAPVKAVANPQSSAQPNTTTAVAPDPFTGKHCIGNKLDFNTTLSLNDYICSSKNNYAFGLNANGDLVWGNDDSNFNHKIFTAQPEYAAADKFVLNQHGRFEIMAEPNQLIWKMNHIFGNEIKPYLQNPVNNLTVPYLSMHNDGVVVLAYYNRTAGELQEHNIMKIYTGIKK
mmetsp:Transcript_20803/g.29668  ORF Transcript_20803/g.29668 Transcript_20803/m.29668 type:complete len:274 (-) Transcript_20803:141-962(-)|eukprot:CAMPEP_0172414332 /NCGR_PEP_ID=MMETSP1064-20121228/1007_1 /TAXON_ID=202472 /ORGANISM="Aulacoseira subarctica , Strain CCAP 1002/5" /LENGTH=273 /DNA_ID=CAMNT_0013150961 /DNA_START=108 /DNA_END=929 /DNA_ORIENTATION=-